MTLSQERQKLYEDLEARIGHTALTEFTELQVANGNVLLLKDESDTVSGMPVPLNHYGRVFARIYRQLEEEGKLRPGDLIFDSSQGNAALALTAIGRHLGFEPYAIIPKGHLPQKMLDYLGVAGANLIETEGNDYVNDFRRAIAKFRQLHPDAVFLNHSMGPNGANHKITLDALGDIAVETLAEITPDYFIGVWGNGSSLFGPARIFSETGVESSGWELFSQAVAYELAYPGKYELEFGIKPSTLSHIHGIPGSSYRGRGKPIDFPHIINAVTGEYKVVADTRLVVDERMLNAYDSIINNPELSAKAAALPHLDDTMNQLLDAGLLYGRTTAGNIAIALELAEQVRNKTIVTLIYDRQDKYDEPLPA